MDCGRSFLMSNGSGEFGKLNIRDLTEACGIALGTFYRYFKSKDDLVLQILEEDWNEVLAGIDAAALENKTLYEKVRDMYEHISTFEKKYRYSAMSLFSATESNMAFREKNVQRLYDRLKLFLQYEMNDGSLELRADLDSAAYLLVQLIIATAKNPKMDFDDLWNCMTFQDRSGQPKNDTANP